MQNKKKFFFVKSYVFLADLTLYNLFYLKKTPNNVPYHFKLKSNFVGQIWPFVLKGLRCVYTRDFCRDNHTQPRKNRDNLSSRICSNRFETTSCHDFLQRFFCNDQVVCSLHGCDRFARQNRVVNRDKKSRV